MLINISSWHYKLVKHKTSFSNLRPGNEETINYIGEVSLAVYLCVFIPIFILAVLTIGHEMMVSKEFDQMIRSEYSVAMNIFFVVMSFPLWFNILLIIIQPLTNREWRELKLK